MEITQPRTYGFRNISLLVTTNILTFVVFWLVQINLSWLTFKLTHSELLLGLLGFFINLPMLLIIPLGGVLSDKFNRKTIMQGTQFVYIIPSLALFALVYTHTISYWNMIAVGLIYGALFGITKPSSDAIIYDICKTDSQMRIAISFNSASSQIAMLFSPYLSKGIITAFGFSSIFIMAGVASMAAFLYVTMMRYNMSMKQSSESQDTFLASFINGLRYCMSKHTLVIFIAAVSMALGVVISLQFQFPAIINFLYHGNKMNLYNFYFFSALGGLTGAVLIVSLLHKHTLNLLFNILVVALTLQAVFLLFLPLIPNIHWVYLIIYLEDCCGIIATIVGTFAIQKMVADEMRGRVLSLVAVTRIGSIPIISLILGVISNFTNIFYGLIIFGIAYLVFIVAAAGYLKKRLVIN